MREVYVPRAELDRGAQAPVLFDALIGEEDHAYVFVKTVTKDDPGVVEQRITPRWPYHLPGELIIALTGQAGGLALRRQGLIDGNWRGHGVRICEARFTAPVFLGERCYLRVETLRVRRLHGQLHVRFRFRMWKHGPTGSEIETYRSEQDAVFFPG